MILLAIIMALGNLGAAFGSVLLIRAINRLTDQVQANGNKVQLQLNRLVDK